MLGPQDSFTLDDDGMPQSRPRSGHSDDSERPRSRKSRSRAQSAKERIDDKHLYSVSAPYCLVLYITVCVFYCLLDGCLGLDMSI